MAVLLSSAQHALRRTPVLPAHLAAPPVTRQAFPATSFSLGDAIVMTTSGDHHKERGLNGLIWDSFPV